MLERDYFSVIKMTPAHTFKGFSPFLSETDKSYLSRFKSEKRQLSTIIVRNLARNLLSLTTGIKTENWEFEILETGARTAIAANGDQFHISFAHSPNWGAVTISNQPIGIDIEETKTGRSWQEMIHFLELPEDTPAPKSEFEFLHHWTAYEAGIKFQSASRAKYTLHHAVISPSTTVCIASSLNRKKPKQITFSETPKSE